MTGSDVARWAVLLTLPAGLLLVPPGPSAATVPVVSGPGQATPPERFFGYEPGEERLYRLGPPESLVPGESAEWRIRFRGYRETEDGSVAEMEFGHRRFELIPGTWNPAEDIMEVRVDGRALLSRDGFPLQVQFEQFFVSQGERLSADGRRRMSYTYLPESREYRKDLSVDGRDWDFEFRVPTHEEIDLEERRGVFLYEPSSLGCLGTSQRTCLAQELSFANPGFLSMVLPYLLEEEPSERDFMFFMPAGIGASPFRPMDVSRVLPRERDNQGNQRRYFERWKLKLGASREVEVGPRTMHAWELEVGGGIDRVWMEPGGRVLRVDLETAWDNPDERHIRLVFPYEDFVTPNEDPAERCCR